MWLLQFNTYVHGRYKYYSFSAGIYRRQILTSKIGPCTEWAMVYRWIGLYVNHNIN